MLPCRAVTENTASPDTSEITEIEKQLADTPKTIDGSRERKELIDRLRKLNDARAVPVLIPYIASEYDGVTRQEAIRALGELDAIAPLVELLKQPVVGKNLDKENSESDARKRAIRALDDTGDLSVVSLLAEIVADEKEYVVVRTLADRVVVGKEIERLSAIESTETVPALIAYLDPKYNGYNRCRAMSRLGVLRDGRAIAPLVKILEQPITRVKPAAEDAQEEVLRNRATEALGIIGDKDDSVVPILEKIATNEDEYEYVRKSASEAIEWLQRKTAPTRDLASRRKSASLDTNVPDNTQPQVVGEISIFKSDTPKSVDDLGISRSSRESAFPAFTNASGKIIFNGEVEHYRKNPDSIEFPRPWGALGQAYPDFEAWVVTLSKISSEQATGEDTTVYRSDGKIRYISVGTSKYKIEPREIFTVQTWEKDGGRLFFTQVGIDGWHYLYDDNGKLVGNKTYRGVGEKFYGGARVAEDYSWVAVPLSREQAETLVRAAYETARQDDATALREMYSTWYRQAEDATLQTYRERTMQANERGTRLDSQMWERRLLHDYDFYTINEFTNVSCREDSALVEAKVTFRLPPGVQAPEGLPQDFGSGYATYSLTTRLCNDKWKIAAVNFSPAPWAEGKERYALFYENSRFRWLKDLGENHVVPIFLDAIAQQAVREAYPSHSPDDWKDFFKGFVWGYANAIADLYTWTESPEKIYTVTPRPPDSQKKLLPPESEASAKKKGNYAGRKAASEAAATPSDLATFGYRLDAGKCTFEKTKDSKLLLLSTTPNTIPCEVINPPTEMLAFIEATEIPKFSYTAWTSLFTSEDTNTRQCFILALKVEK